LSKPEFLASLVNNVIIPNLELSPNDLEIFEDNHREFLAAELEGADIDTKRRSISDLIKALAKSHPQISGILFEYMQKISTQTTWKAKEICVFLASAVSTKNSTRHGGVSELTGLLDVNAFFQTQLMPSLAMGPTSDVGTSYLQAIILKFVISFRKFLVLSDLSVFARLLTSELDAVVDLAAYLLSLPEFAGKLCSAVSMKDITRVLSGRIPEEDEYAMKLIHSLIAASEIKDLPDLSNAVISQFMTRFKHLARPVFIHWYFESLCALSRKGVACESSLVPLMGTEIFQAQNIEMFPYGIQLVSRLIASEGNLVDIYKKLFDFLLEDSLWTKNMLVPALIIFVNVYCQKYGADITEDKRQKILGKLQYLMKKSENFGFDMLTVIFTKVADRCTDDTLAAIFNFVFGEISSKKTDRKCRLFAASFSACLKKQGIERCHLVIEKIQPGLFKQVLLNLWMPNAVLGKKETRNLTAAVLIKLITSTGDLEIKQAAVETAKKMSSATEKAGNDEAEGDHHASSVQEEFEGQFVKLGEISRYLEREEDHVNYQQELFRSLG
jgi:exportin-2 (importin alpha re-exporter)